MSPVVPANRAGEFIAGVTDFCHKHHYTNVVVLGAIKAGASKVAARSWESSLTVKRKSLSAWWEAGGGGSSPAPLRPNARFHEIRRLAGSSIQL